MSAGKITPQSLQFANAINEVANRDKITPNDTPRADAIAPVGYARAQDLLLYREVWAGYSNKPADENGHPPVALYTQDQVDALLAAERERLREDAERYRWLREDRVIPADFYPSIPWTVRVVLDPLPTTRPVRGGALDAAIDAARRK